MTNKCFLLFFLLFLSCYRVPDKLDPKVCYPIQDRHFSHLTSAFSPLSFAEKSSDWGREMIIANAFAKELDLYRAISTYKRAEILLNNEDENRKLEIEYDIFLCFFLANRYDEAVDAFEKSGLACVDKMFPAYHDLLLALYESYREMDCPEKEERVLELMEKSFPETAEKIKLSRALREGNLEEVEAFAQNFKEKPSYLDQLLTSYKAQKKSVAKAQLLNALIPGAGYLYIGQKKSAFTAFLLNGLFIAAAYQFFHRGHIAAGAITVGFETGWYFGGIYGGGEEAKFYNERLYENKASYVLNDHMLFPILMMEHSF